MARLWTGGNELQFAAAGEYSNIATNAPALETTIKRSGNAAWRITNTSALEGFRHQFIGAVQGLYYFRFYLYVVAFPTGAVVMLGGSRSTGTNLINIRLTSAGALNFRNTEDSATIGSDSSALSLNTWYRIEMSYDTTTLSATLVEARAYVDTPGNTTPFWNPSGTVDLSITPNSYGCFTNASDATLDFVVDDCAINDTTGSFENTWCGEGEVVCLRPNEAGDNAAWARGGTDTGANHSQCSETPPDDATTYVQSNTSGQIDDYEMDATPAALESTDTINVVHVGVRAAVSDATGADPDMVIRIKSAAAGTVEESAAMDVNSLTWNSPIPNTLPLNYALTLYDLPGASTSVWTKTLLDTLQAGFREAVTDTHFVRVSALWVLVDHKPGGAPPAVITRNQGFIFG